MVRYWEVGGTLVLWIVLSAHGFKCVRSACIVFFFMSVCLCVTKINEKIKLLYFMGKEPSDWDQKLSMCASVIYIYLHFLTPDTTLCVLLFLSVRRKHWRQEHMCVGVSSLWLLLNKEAASPSVGWRLSWTHCWRVSSHSTHQVSSPRRDLHWHYHPSMISSFAITFYFFCSTERDLEQRHMAFCSLFSDALTLLNGVGVSTGEALAAHVITWLDKKGRGFPILPLLTACSCRLASVRHMTRIMEACITAYFSHGKQSCCFQKL